MERGRGVWTFYFLVLVGTIGVVTAKLSSHRLCYDKKCEEPVSHGMSTMRYTASEPGMLSLKPNEKVTVYSYPAGDNPTLLGVEVNGKRGYVPKNFVRELKVERRPKRMVEVNGGSPKERTKEPSKDPPEPIYPYSPEYREQQQQPTRRRVVGPGHDWHHKYLKTLRERQQQQQQLQEEQQKLLQQQQQQQQQKLQEEQQRLLQQQQQEQERLRQQQLLAEQERQQQFEAEKQQLLAEQQREQEQLAEQQKQQEELQKQQQQQEPPVAAVDPATRQPPPPQADVDPASFQPADQLLGQHPHLHHGQAVPRKLDSTGGHRGLFGATPGSAAAQPSPPPAAADGSAPTGDVLEKPQDVPAAAAAGDAHAVPLVLEKPSLQTDQVIPVPAASDVKSSGPATDEASDNTADDAAPDSSDDYSDEGADSETPGAELDEEPDYPGDNDTDDAGDAAEEGYDAAGDADTEAPPLPSSEEQLKTDTEGQALGVGTIEQVGGPVAAPSEQPAPPLESGGVVEPLVPEAVNPVDSGAAPTEPEPEAAADAGGSFWGLGGSTPPAPEPAEPAPEPVPEPAAATEEPSVAAEEPAAAGGSWGLWGASEQPVPAEGPADPASPDATAEAVVAEPASQATIEAPSLGEQPTEAYPEPAAAVDASAPPPPSVGGVPASPGPTSSDRGPPLPTVLGGMISADDPTAAPGQPLLAAERAAMAHEPTIGVAGASTTGTVRGNNGSHTAVAQTEADGLSEAASKVEGQTQVDKVVTVTNDARDGDAVGDKGGQMSNGERGRLEDGNEKKLMSGDKNDEAVTKADETASPHPDQMADYIGHGQVVNEPQASQTGDAQHASEQTEGQNAEVNRASADSPEDATAGSQLINGQTIEQIDKLIEQHIAEDQNVAGEPVRREVKVEAVAGDGAVKQADNVEENDNDFFDDEDDDDVWGDDEDEEEDTDELDDDDDELDDSDTDTNGGKLQTEADHYGAKGKPNPVASDLNSHSSDADLNNAAVAELNSGNAQQPHPSGVAATEPPTVDASERSQQASEAGNENEHQDNVEPHNERGIEEDNTAARESEISSPSAAGSVSSDEESRKDVDMIPTEPTSEESPAPGDLSATAASGQESSGSDADSGPEQCDGLDCGRGEPTNPDASAPDPDPSAVDSDPSPVDPDPSAPNPDPSSSADPDDSDPDVADWSLSSEDSGEDAAEREERGQLRRRRRRLVQQLKQRRLRNDVPSLSYGSQWGQHDPAADTAGLDDNIAAPESTPTDPVTTDSATTDPITTDSITTDPAATGTEAENPYAVPETDQSAYSHSQSAYGESAYGESAYGDSAYSHNAYAQSAPEPEAPGLMAEVLATLLPSSLWGLADGYSAGHDDGTCSTGGGGGGARVSVLLSTIGLSLACLFIGLRAVSQFRCDSQLKSTISKLHQRLTVYKEETDALKSKLDVANKQLLEGGSAATQAALQAAAADQQAAEEELEEARHQMAELGRQVASLEQELQEAQQLLEEQTAVISTQQSSASNPQLDSMIVETVGKLETDLKQQRKKLMGEIEKLKKEKKKLTEELAVSRPLIKQLEAKVTELGSSSRVSAEVEEQHQRRVDELTARAESEAQRCAALTEERDAAAEQLTSLESRITELESQRDAARDQAETLTQEVDALKTMMKAAQDGNDNGSEEKLQALLEGGKMKAQVEKLTKERAKLKEKWKQEREMLKKAQEAEKTLSTELSQLSERCEKAEVERFEAESKLDHLEKYFQKKELSFQQEMGVLKSRLNHTEGDASSSQGLLVQYEEQIATYKAQVESLKQEIQETERSFRSQIQALEKRAHESWVTCRQAERRLEEANREAQQYRALLTKAEEEKNNLVNGQASLQSFNSNGTGAVSPGPEVDPLSDPLLSAAFLPPPPPPLDPFLAAPPPPPPGGDPSFGLPPPLPPLYGAPLPPPDGRYDDFGPRGYGRDSPLSDRSHRSERGYVSPPPAGRRGPGRDWSPPPPPRRTLSRSSFSPDRLSDRGRSPDRDRHRPPPPRYVGGHDDFRGPKTSSPLVQDDYGRPHDKRKEQRYDRI